MLPDRPLSLPLCVMCRDSELCKYCSRLRLSQRAFTGELKSLLLHRHDIAHAVRCYKPPIPIPSQKPQRNIAATMDDRRSARLLQTLQDMVTAAEPTDLGEIEWAVMRRVAGHNHLFPSEHIPVPLRLAAKLLARAKVRALDRLLSSSELRWDLEEFQRYSGALDMIPRRLLAVQGWGDLAKFDEIALMVHERWEDEGVL